MGAWIEISYHFVIRSFSGVAPLVGAWIEIHLSFRYRNPAPLVAPLVGAWIEIIYITYICRAGVVAPLVGAWIEITMKSSEKLELSRRSSRGSVD